MKQNLEQQHFQIKTQECWSHTWRKPSFQYLESAHFNGTRFLNPLHAPEGRSHFDLFKWLLKRKSSTWDK
ncbi:MAG TPA: Zn-dependent hydrolase, partial [Acinetobacter sp.]|nr:Zn-dependent hydrolase [Acinetobacter sp.]